MKFITFLFLLLLSGALPQKSQARTLEPKEVDESFVSFDPQAILNDWMAPDPVIDLSPHPSEQNDNQTADSVKKEPNYLEMTAPRVTENSLVLWGRGFTGRRHHQRLLIACVGKDHSCATLQFVYIRSARDAFWIGPRFSVIPIVKHQKIQSIEDSFKQDMKVFVKTTHGANSDIGAITYFVLGVGGVLLGQATGGISAIVTASLVFLSLDAKNGYSPFITSLDFTAPFKKGFRVKASEALFNQDGWSWSSHPVTIGEKKFGDLVTHINNGLMAHLLKANLTIDPNYQDH